MDKYRTIKEKILPSILPFGVKRVALFGSCVRDEETATSDLDVLVSLKPVGKRPCIGLKWFALEEELSRIMGCKVDLVSEKALSRHLRPFIEKELVILYEEE